MARMTAGLSMAERREARQRIRARAIAQAERLGLTLRCRMVMDDMDSPEHQRCQGEEPGNSGCLCRCHDR